MKYIIKPKNQGTLGITYMLEQNFSSGEIHLGNLQITSHKKYPDTDAQLSPQPDWCVANAGTAKFGYTLAAGGTLKVPQIFIDLSPFMDEALQNFFSYKGKYACSTIPSLVEQVSLSKSLGFCSNSSPDDSLLLEKILGKIEKKGGIKFLKPDELETLQKNLANALAEYTSHNPPAYVIKQVNDPLEKKVLELLIEKSLP